MGFIRKKLKQVKNAVKKVGKAVKKAVKKSDARPFKVPEDITLMVVDPNTGDKAKFSSKNTISNGFRCHIHN